MAYDYSALEVVVTADTRGLTAEIRRSAEAAGTQASKTISDHMSKGFKALGPVAGQVGKAAVTGLGLATTAAVAFGVKAAKAAEASNKVTAQTAAVIKSTGGAANVTAKQIQGLANSIMAKTGIDDESVKSGQNMLLTFTNIRNETGKGNQVFNQATQTLTDMTAAMTGGNVTQESMRKQAILLGKALNDPVKGLTALQRVGVSFTDQQKQQITALVKSGHTLEAQKIILGELNKEFGGSAAAQATATERIKTTYKEMQESIGQVVLKAIDPFMHSLGKLASQIGAAIAPGGKLAPIFNAIGSALAKAIGPLTKFTDMIGRGLAKLKPAQINQIADAIKRFGPAIAALGGASALLTGGGILTQLPIFGGVIQHLIGPLKMIIPLLGGGEGLAGAFKFLTGPVGIILGIFTTLMAVSPQFRQAVIGLVQALIVGLMPAFKAIFAAIKPLMPVIVMLGKMLGQILAPVIKALTPLLVQLMPLVAVLAQLVGKLLGVVILLIGPILKVYMAFEKWYVIHILVPLINVLVGALSWLVRIITDVVKWIMGGSPGLIPAFNALMRVVGSVVHFIRNVVITGFNAIKGAIQAAWKFITQNSVAVWNFLKTFIQRAIQGWINIFKAGFNVIRGLFTSGWRILQNATTSVWNFLRGFIQRAIQGWINIFQSAWSTIRGLFTRGWNAVIGTIKNAASNLIGVGKSVISNFLSGISSAVRGIGSWIKSHVVDPVVNAVKSFFGIHSPSSVIADLGRNVTEGFVKGIVEQNPLTVAKKVFGGIPNALGAIVSKGLVSLGALPGKALRALGTVGGAIKGVLGKIGGFFGNLFSGGGGAGVQQWAGLVSRVLAMLGLPASYLGPWLAQMQTESGGQPNVINRWDSNAAAGIPSQGLLQVIPPTFAAYAGPFRGLGILSPLANVYAAINYALHRYGRFGMLGVIGHGHGYAAGGLISEPITGVGHRTGTTYTFGERGPEWVTPLGGSGRAITVNVYPRANQSETEIAAAVSRSLAWAAQTGKA